jgi:hypothetical protein
MALPHASRVSDSPEWRLIVAVARTRMDEVQRERIRALLSSPIDWARMTEMASRHRVSAVSYPQLAREAIGAMPLDIRALLERDAARRIPDSLSLAAQMTGLLRAFEEARVPAVPFKGPALASMAYGSVALRDSSDLDFVLPQSHIPRAFEVMAGAGYRADLDAKSPREASFIARGVAGQFCFQREGRASVELHSEKTLRYFPIPLDFAGLSRRLCSLPVAGQPVRTFSPEDTLVLLAVHGAKHFWNCLGWICDIAELSQAPPGIDWELSERIATQMRCRRMWLLALSLAHYVRVGLPPAPRRTRRDSKRLRGRLALSAGAGATPSSTRRGTERSPTFFLPVAFLREPVGRPSAMHSLNGSNHRGRLEVFVAARVARARVRRLAASAAASQARPPVSTRTVLGVQES